MKKLVMLMVLAGACQKMQPKEDENGRPSWGVSVKHLAPKAANAGWSRVVQLSGSRMGQVLVDKQIKGSEIWKEVGLTNENGQYVDHEFTEEARYRFGGFFETPWYQALKNLFITSATTLPAKIEGTTCVVEASTTIYLGLNSLEFNCDEVLIYGNIYSFSGPAGRLPSRDGASGSNSGNLTIKAQTVDIQGHVWLLGQDGGTGLTIKISTNDAGFNGGNGGAGGTVSITANEISQYDAFKVDGGIGGAHGLHTNGNPAPSNGTEGARGKVIINKL